MKCLLSFDYYLSLAIWSTTWRTRRRNLECLLAGKELIFQAFKMSVFSTNTHLYWTFPSPKLFANISLGHLVLNVLFLKSLILWLFLFQILLDNLFLLPVYMPFTFFKKFILQELLEVARDPISEWLDKLVNKPFLATWPAETIILRSFHIKKSFVLMIWHTMISCNLFR